MTNDTPFGATFTTAEAPSYSVSGEVKSAGASLPGATVKIGNDARSADKDGRFTFPSVPAGRHDISASKDGFADASGSVDVLGDTEVSIELESIPTKRVLTTATGVPAGPVLGFMGAAALLFGLVYSGRADSGMEAVRNALGRVLERFGRP